MIDYRDSGVRSSKNDQPILRMKDLISRTFNTNVVGGIGGFSAVYRVPGTDRLLSAGIDGVGTKLRLAFALKRYDTVGIDCVAMNVNDVLTSGLTPHFFLDYFACGRLDEPVFHSVITGLSAGCLDAGCALIGGETAEMPGCYPEDEFDLAGCAVGIGTEQDLLKPESIEAGDCIIGLPSTGVHSNGFSLVRKIIETAGHSLDMPMNGSTLGEVLLTPTRIYVKEILNARKECRIKALVHVTGGGFPENIPRALPAGLGSEIRHTWDTPEIFRFLQKQGSISNSEMYRVFNMGIGMLAFVASGEKKRLLSLLPGSVEVGTVIPGSGVEIC
ncbi:MAG: phosphoribosylformylglycinamidine cyclo-ligase [Candidatus Wallbacteria bacterium]|nr:phosphoribosylformylglycinamidine cyclo-ligase [Candidatus Wallbacteria bacterium]